MKMGQSHLDALVARRHVFPALLLFIALFKLTFNRPLRSQFLRALKSESGTLKATKNLTLKTTLAHTMAPKPLNWNQQRGKTPQNRHPNDLAEQSAATLVTIHRWKARMLARCMPNFRILSARDDRIVPDQATMASHMTIHRARYALVQTTSRTIFFPRKFARRMKHLKLNSQGVQHLVLQLAVLFAACSQLLAHLGLEGAMAVALCSVLMHMELHR